MQITSPTKRNLSKWKKHLFFEKRYLPITEFPDLVKALEKKAKLKIKLTCEHRLYGYEISGGGIISKVPRYRSKRRAEEELIGLLLNMLGLTIESIPNIISEYRNSRKP